MTSSPDTLLDVLRTLNNEPHRMPPGQLDISDRHARHFYDVKRDSDPDEWERFSDKAREEFDLDPDSIAARGKQYIIENDIPGYDSSTRE